MPRSNKTVCKITIIGPRPYNLGGHDLDNDIRRNIYQKIQEIVQRYLKNNNIVLLGLTGLEMGCEQDFAEICLENKIDYIVYLTHENIEKRWGSYPQYLIDRYTRLLDHSMETHTISDGNYSPKKVMIKNKRLIKEADIILYISHPFKKNKICSILNYCKELDKKVVLIS